MQGITTLNISRSPEEIVNVHLGRRNCSIQWAWE